MIEQSIRTIPDNPKPGIQFRDFTTLLGDPLAYAAAVEALMAPYADAPASERIAKVAGIEARVFI